MTDPDGVRFLGPLTEWTSEVYHDVALMPEDRAVAAKSWASADDRVQIEELRQGLRVRTRSWVGVVRLPTVEIRIAPKVTGDQLRLVTRLVEQILPAARYRVSSQIAFKSVVWNVSSQRPYANIIPDVVVERRGHSDCRVAIDAKYKLYDERGFDQGDIYQTFLYAFALGATASDGLPTSLLLYPATAREPENTRLRIRRLTGGAGAELVGIGLPVAALLKELTTGSGDTPLRDGLATVIDEAFGNADHRQAAEESFLVRRPTR